MPCVLITGANRGIGLEFARQYAADGWRVIATCRRPNKAKELSSLSGKVEIHPLDVARFSDIDTLASSLKGSLDVLINNAGINPSPDQNLADIDGKIWSRVFAVNSIAPLLLARAFLPHLRRGERGRIVNVSSILGSIASNHGGYYKYGSSKAALNAATVSLAHEVGEKGLIAVVVHPGWVKTDMGGARAPVTPAESVSGLRHLIDRLDAGDNGRYYTYEGKKLPW